MIFPCLVLFKLKIKIGCLWGLLAEVYCTHVKCFTSVILRCCLHSLKLALLNNFLYCSICAISTKLDNWLTEDIRKDQLNKLSIISISSEYSTLTKILIFVGISRRKKINIATYRMNLITSRYRSLSSFHIRTAIQIKIEKS